MTYEKLIEKISSLKKDVDIKFKRYASDEYASDEYKIQLAKLKNNLDLTLQNAENLLAVVYDSK